MHLSVEQSQRATNRHYLSLIVTDKAQWQEQQAGSIVAIGAHRASGALALAEEEEALAHLSTSS